MRLSKLYLEHLPQPMRAVCVAAWNGRYPHDIVSEVSSGQEAFGRLVMDGSPSCTVELPFTCTRRKQGNRLCPDAGTDGSFAGHLKPGDLVRVEGTETLHARVQQKADKSSNNFKDVVTLAPLAKEKAPPSDQPGQKVYAQRVHNMDGSKKVDQTQRDKMERSGISEDA